MQRMVVAGMLLLGIVLAPLGLGSGFLHGPETELSAEVAEEAPLEDAPLANPATSAKPAAGLTLPNGGGPFTTIVYDDFEWCSAAPCEVRHADPAVLQVKGFSYIVNPAGSWRVQEGGVDGGHAVYAVAPGTLEISVRTGADALGSWTLGFAAQGPLVGATQLLEGGLDVSLVQTIAGAPVGPMECGFVPLLPASGGGFSEYVATNPACMFAPLTTEMRIILHARPGADGSLPSLAFDNLIVQKV